MNYKIIVYIIGFVLKIEAALLLLPLLVGILYQEQATWALLYSVLICAVVGFALSWKRPKNDHFHVKEGYVAVALSWIVLSIFGALPFMLSGVIPHPIDAIFETVSGFTTTGASILPEVESLPKCILFWRSFTHWIGGMGVLVFLLTILKMGNGSHMNLMKAESPGPSVSKLVPTVRSTAKLLYSIYLIMTLALIVFLLVGKMSLFDAVTTAFGTAGTGGFGIKNDSIGSYSIYIQVVVTIFMILFGVNFNAYYLILAKKWKQAFSIEEVRWYFIIIVTAVVIIGIDVMDYFGNNILVSIQQAAFQVGSIITTTGFATTDFNLWPELSRTILVLLMFVGACAGSTGGGMKVSRFLIIFKAMKKEMHQYLHPRQVRKIHMDGKTVEHEVVRNVNVFIAAYFSIYVISMLVLSLDGLDLITNFTAIAATLNNIGPGLELVGPASNFGVYSYASKIMLTFDMLAGRLEIFPLILLFFRDTWKKF
ncbi:MAG: TrkH family potassium uptake protein [Ruminococcus sp.]|nr:TrkH family potassium uptake protein [Ruminococcus sp.]